MKRKRVPRRRSEVKQKRRTHREQKRPAGPRLLNVFGDLLIAAGIGFLGGAVLSNARLRKKAKEKPVPYRISLPPYGRDPAADVIEASFQVV